MVFRPGARSNGFDTHRCSIFGHDFLFVGAAQGFIPSDRLRSRGRRAGRLQALQGGPLGRASLAIVEGLTTKGVGLRILAMPVDTTTPTGRLMLQVLGAVGEFEHAALRERQREGIAKAKREEPLQV